MGWLGTVKKYKTNLENVKFDLLNGEVENEKQWYREIVQRGSHVYILGQNKDDGKYWVDCIACKTIPRKWGKEWMWKCLNALDCFDFPKKWVSLLDCSKEVQAYIKARENYETQKKGEYKPVLGNIFRCTCSYDLHWKSFSIKSGEVFYIKYTSWYGHRHFMLCTHTGGTYGCSVSRKIFNTFEKKLHDAF